MYNNGYVGHEDDNVRGLGNGVHIHIIFCSLKGAGGHGDVQQWGRGG
jgi:hypothetical protein